jgi:NRAMP (natural resistance-associated macrophage protein)-like metal ion transporter
MTPPPHRAAAAAPATPPRRGWLGPGLVTGASDDDPSGIATYAQAGARFGYQLAWTLLFTYPLMVAIQEISARIGRTTGYGLAGNLRRHYPAWLLRAVAALLCVANTINIGADLGAMAEAVRLLFKGLPAGVWVALFALGCTLAQVLFNQRRYARLLRWLTLSLGAYIAVLFAVHLPWGEVLTGLALPRGSADVHFWQMAVAVLGTTISPYMLFWQAAEEVEDTRAAPHGRSLRRAPSQGKAELARIRLDTAIGMALSNLVGLAILITSAATLRAAGVHDIQSAAQAAQALRPVAGRFAEVVFALGIIGTGLLAVPVLAGSAAYALGETCRWPVGLACRVRRAPGFYATIAATTLIGALANAAPVGAIQALVLAAVVNGVIAVPVMAVVVLMARDARIMGRFTVSPRLALVGWIATAVMGLAAIGLLVSAL